MSDKFVPWALWGRYEKFEEVPNHQLVHVAPTDIEFIYRKTVGNDKSIVNRVFDVPRYMKVGEIHVVMATERLEGAKSWDIHFRKDDGTWDLYVPDTQKETQRPIPMTEKYWVGRFDMRPVLGVNVVFWLGLLFLLWYWHYYG